MCTICYCEFEKDEKLIELKCKHIYHEECIVKWVENTAKCPVCKARLTERPIFEEEDEEENYWWFKDLFISIICLSKINWDD